MVFILGLQAQQTEQVMDIQKTVLKENKAMQQQLKKKLQKSKEAAKRLPNYSKEQLDSMVLALKENRN